MSATVLPEFRDHQEREQRLLRMLPQLVRRAQAAPGWARILHGIDPAVVSTREALAALPVTRKSALSRLQREKPPFGGLTAVPTRELRRIMVSPGPIFDPQGTDEDWWRFAPPMRAIGLQAGDIIQNCFSYHFTPGAFMVEAGAQKMGCVVIPAGSGQTELQVQAIASLRPVAYVGTPSFLRIILERAAEMGADTGSMRKALVCGEALPPALRDRLHQLGMRQVLQVYATADVGAIAYETQTGGKVYPGMVLNEDILVDIVQPDTDLPVEAGEIGELVVTSFNAAYPLIRFGTGDLSRMLDSPSSCGRTNARIAGWLGRADQSVKVRGMFVHPSQVLEVLKRHPEVAKARLIVSEAQLQDVMTLHCEIGEQQVATADAIAKSMRDVISLRCEVNICQPGSLPCDGRWIEDLRAVGRQ